MGAPFLAAREIRVVHGWQSNAALLAVREARSELRETLAQIGTSLVQCTGRERVSTDLFWIRKERGRPVSWFACTIQV